MNMKTLSLTLAFLASFAARSYAAPSPLLPLEGSVLWLEGDSSLHPYSSTTTKLGLAFTLERDAAQPAAAAIKAQKEAKLTLTVPVASLKSAHSGLDKNLRKALSADKYPDIVFVLESYKLDPDGVTAAGTLTIAGASKPVTLRATLAEKGEGLLLEGKHDLLMTDFGVKPPKMMMGAIKCADKVTVYYRLALGAGSAS